MSKTVDMARLVRDACELLEPVAEDKGLRLSVRNTRNFPSRRRPANDPADSLKPS